MKEREVDIYKVSITDWDGNERLVPRVLTLGEINTGTDANDVCERWPFYCIEEGPAIQDPSISRFTVKLKQSPYCYPYPRSSLETCDPVTVVHARVNGNL